MQSGLPRSLLAASKLRFSRDAFQWDQSLPDDSNSFQRDWLLQILFSALFADAAPPPAGIEAVAADILSEDRLENVFHGVMDDIFGAIPQTIPTMRKQMAMPPKTAIPMWIKTTRGLELTKQARRGGPSRLQNALALQLAR